MKKFGFTLIEIIIVLGIVSIIISFSSLNLISLKNKSSINSAVTQLVADIRQQQMKTMIGDSSELDDFGVYFLGNTYILFKGNTYVSKPENFVVNLESNLSFINSNPTKNSIIFSKGNGELTENSLNQIVLINNKSNESKTLNLNHFGVIESVVSN